jgi:hypothetical protein
LPWILFERDRNIFQQEFPHWRIEGLHAMLPLSYLLSGGVSMISLVPMFLFEAGRSVEKALSRWNTHLAMFAFIRLQKV